jgi:hypothetical protein
VSGQDVTAFIKAAAAFTGYGKHQSRIPMAMFMRYLSGLAVTGGRRGRK